MKKIPVIFNSMKKILAVFLCAFVLVGCSDMDNASTVEETKSDRAAYPEDLYPLTDEELRAMEEEVIRQTNEYRVSLGLNELEEDEDLAYVARIRAKEIVTDFSHTRPDGTRYVDILNRMNYQSRLVGENLGKNQTKVSTVMEMWIESPSHEANLSGDFNKIGVAVFQSEGLFLHYVQIFAQ